MQQVAESRRPLGITIISIILFIIGILFLIGVILGFVGVNVLLQNHHVLDAVASIVLIVAGLVAIAELVVAWGLWTLKRWAFWTAVIVEAIRLVQSLYSWLVAHNPLGSVLFSLVVAIIILVYLFADPNVRAAFRT